VRLVWLLLLLLSLLPAVSLVLLKDCDLLILPTHQLLLLLPLLPYMLHMIHIRCCCPVRNCLHNSLQLPTLRRSFHCMAPTQLAAAALAALTAALLATQAHCIANIHIHHAAVSW
jgi:hypothetical protein